MKKSIFIISLLSVITATLTVALLLLSVYCRLLTIEHKEQIRKAEETIESLEDQLERFTNPIDYHAAAAPIYDISLSQELQEYTYDMCSFYDVDYELALALMWHESNFDAAAISSTDDYGLMQINEVNHDYLRETLGIVDFLDPYDNIECGVYTISTLVHEYEDNNLALMVYNMGRRGAAKCWSDGIYKSVYSQSVLAKMEKLKEYIRE